MLVPTQAFPAAHEKVPASMLDVRRRRNNVHDFVFLNSIERELLDTPEMQRLRYIKQLGFAHLVYETAEHSRFVHSIGVCHTAKLLVDCINRNHRIAVMMANSKKSISEKRQMELFSTEQNGCLRGEVPCIPWVQRTCIGLAGLLHDIPHPPLSHALEHESSVLVKHDDVKENPQLYLYLFDGNSGLANVLRGRSEDFHTYFLQQGDDFGFGRQQVAEFLARNDLTKDELLAGLIFEILAFHSPERHPDWNFEYLRNWDSNTLSTFHLSKFFRPFCAEIITDTISADLIDYLMRDALNTGVPKSLELKFLDRMFVKRKPRTEEDRSRVVFNLCDRRGGLRKDAVSDLLALLESRYCLMERVYMHRSKLAASAMLGRAYLFARAAENDDPSAVHHSFKPENLYTFNHYTSDDALLRGLIKHGPRVSQELASRIVFRNLFKPLFIVDEEACRKAHVSLDKPQLVQKFRPAHHDHNGWQSLIGTERKLAAVLLDQRVEQITSHPVVVFCMGENVTFKDPRVLVEIPSEEKGDDASDDLQEISDPDGFRSVDEVEGMLRFLKDFTTDHGAQSQIKTMLTNYNSLWKLYVFADIDCVRKNFSRIPLVYATLMREIGSVLPVTGLWSSDFGSGLRITDEDLRQAFLDLNGEPCNLLELLTHPSITGETRATWTARLRALGIARRDYERVYAELKVLIKQWKPMHNFSVNVVTAADRATAKRWLMDQLRRIKQEENGHDEAGETDG